MILKSEVQRALPSLERRARIIVGLLLALALSACSTVRLVYDNAPTLAYWWLDGYFDFDSTQATAVRQRLQQLHAWHRAEELPTIRSWLAGVREHAADPTDSAEVCRWLDQLRPMALRLSYRAAEVLADQVSGLQPEQLRRYEREWERKEREWRRDYAAPHTGKGLERRVERTLDRYESLYGKLDDHQRGLVQSRVARTEFPLELLLAERDQRHADMRQLLNSLRTRNPDPAALRAWIDDGFASPRAPYRQLQQRWQQQLCEQVAALHNSSSPAQRQHLIEKLADWERALAAP